MDAPSATTRASGLSVPDWLRTAASSTWVLGGLVFVLTWGGGAAELTVPNIDNSYHAGMQMAAVQGLEYGPEVLVTYGPLGFMKSNLIFEAWPARLAGLYGIALHLALSLSLVWAARRNFAVALAFVVGLVVAMFARGDLTLIGIRDDAAVVVLAFIWCVAALREDAPPWVRRLVLYGGGPYAALELLTKINTGVIVLAIVGITAVAMENRRLRNASVVLASFTATAAALWLLSGQAFANVGTYLSGMFEIVTGYSSGARLDYGQDERKYDYVFAPILFVITASVLWVATRRMEPIRRLATALITAIVVFQAAKGGFVAHEVFHMGVFYATVLGALIAFQLPDVPRLRYGYLAAIAVATGMAASTSYDGYTRDYKLPYPMFNPVDNVAHAAETVAILASGRLEDELDDRRQRLVDAYDLDPRSQRLLEGHTVHLDPSETAAIWAYELDWQPLPVFQPYMAWTPELDRRNAEAMASPDGPERILRQDIHTLGRYIGYESPAAMIEMLCNFEALRTTPKWQVLGRVPDRCGEPRPLETAHTTFGEPLAVPEAPPGSIVFARVHGIGVEGLERLRKLLLRARGRQIVFSNDDQYWSLLEATAKDGLIMRAPPSIDFPDPYALAPNPDEVTFFYEGGPSPQEITVEFFAMPIRPVAK